MLGNSRLQTIIWTSRVAEAERFYTDVLELPLRGKSDQRISGKKALRRRRHIVRHCSTAAPRPGADALFEPECCTRDRLRGLMRSVDTSRSYPTDVT